MIYVQLKIFKETTKFNLMSAKLFNVSYNPARKAIMRMRRRDGVAVIPDPGAVPLTTPFGWTGSGQARPPSLTWLHRSPQSLSPPPVPPVPVTGSPWGEMA